MLLMFNRLYFSVGVATDLIETTWKIGEIGIEGSKLDGKGEKIRDLASLSILIQNHRILINYYKLAFLILQANDILTLLHHLSYLHYNLIPT
jgi:hypothetical protein